MTIPGRGDLAPPRRHRYGRRRWPRVLAVVVVLAVLAAGGYFAWRHWHGSGSGGAPAAAAPTPKPCPSPKFATTLPKHPAAVDVLNGTHRDGIAHGIAKALHKAGGLPSGRVANARQALHGQSVVRYAPGDQFEAWYVAARIQPAARLVKTNGLHKVELTIGSTYKRLASPAEQNAAVNSIASRLLGCHYNGIHIAG